MYVDNEGGMKVTVINSLMNCQTVQLLNGTHMVKELWRIFQSAMKLIDSPVV